MIEKTKKIVKILLTIPPGEIPEDIRKRIKGLQYMDGPDAQRHMKFILDDCINSGRTSIMFLAGLEVLLETPELWV